MTYVSYSIIHYFVILQTTDLASYLTGTVRIKYGTRLLLEYIEKNILMYKKMKLTAKSILEH